MTPDPEHEARVAAIKKDRADAREYVRRVVYKRAKELGIKAATPWYLTDETRRAAGLESGRSRQMKKAATDARIRAAEAVTPKRRGSQKAIARAAGVSTSYLRKRKKKRY